MKCRTFASGRYLLFASMAMLSISLGLLIAGATTINKADGSVNKFHGYECLPLIFMLLAFLPMFRFPKYNTFGEPHVYDNHVSGRFFFATCLTLVPLVVGLIVVYFMWLGPYPHYIEISPSGRSSTSTRKLAPTIPAHIMQAHLNFGQPLPRGIFSSPTPSPSRIPKRIKVQTDADPVGGTFLIGSYLAMLLAIVCLWFYVSEDHGSNEHELVSYH